MEFWGVEVKPGEQLKVQPQLGKLIHISQAALGEVKDVKGAKHVPLRMKIDDKSFILGALSAEERTQLMFDLVFERQFELSHDCKNGSVYFMGYIADDSVSDEEDSSDESDDELVDALQNGNIKQKIENVKDAKIVSKAGDMKEEKPVSDEDEDASEFDSDEEMAFIKSEQENFGDDSEQDSEDEMVGGFSSEEEAEPLKAQQTKKRPAASAPAPVNKKAKPSAPKNTGNKKTVHNVNPLPSKQAAKNPASNKSNQKNKKNNGLMSRK